MTDATLDSGSVAARTAASGDTELDRAAEAWLVRLTSREAAPADFRAVGEWCALSPAHRDAFRRARRFWRLAGANHRASSKVGSNLHFGERRSARARAAFGLAAALVLTALLGFFASTQHWLADYRTAVGERRVVTLADGSRITLDASTAINVDYSAHGRDIYLLRGQALFSVTPDARRPFVVHDRETKAAALGTEYAVTHFDAGSRVTVREGTVSVARTDGAAVTLSAGRQANVGPSGIEVEAVETGIALAWERGVLVCRATPLPEVVAELNRHRRGLIVLAGDDARNIKVSGVFRLDDLEGAANVLSSTLPVQMTSLANYLIVLH